MTLVSICQWSCQGQQLHARALRQADLTAVAHAPSPSATLPNQAGASKVSFKLNTTSISNRQWINVSWSGVAAPTVQDCIGLYFQGSSVDQVLPLKYKWITQSPGANTTGAGSLTFNLLNQRQNLVFRYFTNVSASLGGFSNLTLAGESPVVTLANPNEPLHGHLSLNNDSSQIIVQWTTRDAGSPTVQFGTTKGGPYPSTVAGTSVTYNASTMCGEPANSTGYVDPGSLHRATLTSLKPSTRYYYVYGDPSFGPLSAEHTFLTAPPVGINSTIKFLAIADLGHTELDNSNEYDYDWSGDYENLDSTGTLTQTFDIIRALIIDNEYQQGASRGTVEAMAQDPGLANYTLFLLDGDVSYARGMETMWDVFMDQMENLTSQVPWMLTNGNHERDFPNSGDRYSSGAYEDAAIDSGGECGVPYEYRFDLPYPTGEGATFAADNGNNYSSLWYSFDQGPVHFLQYSTELPFGQGSAQYEWIINDLSSVNRNITPWIIVNGHRPIYTTSTSPASNNYGVIAVAEDLQASLEDVFYEFQVDLTWHGHDHIYERTCPVYKKLCQGTNADGTNAGPVHVVIGHSGYELSFFANPYPPNYWEVIILEHGYMRCTANATSLSCEMVSSTQVGKVLDTYTFTKPAGWQPAGVKAMRALAANQNVVYHANTTIETSGIPGGNYTAIEAVVYPLLQGANSSLLTNLLAMNSSTAYLNAVNFPDTMVLIDGLLGPVRELLAQAMAANASIAQSGAGIMAYIEQTHMVAQLQSSGGSAIWFDQRNSTAAAA